MAENTVNTQFDLRNPAQRDALDRKVWAFVNRRKTPFTCRAMCESLGCSIPQGRRMLLRLIHDGVLGYSGKTKDTVYIPR